MIDGGMKMTMTTTMQELIEAFVSVEKQAFLSYADCNKT
jgi:hypothetical protein